MAIKLATGTALAIATAYGTAVNMTALTNATEAVATLGAGHGVVVGDFLEVTSGWDLLTGRIVRAKTVVTNDVTFELINTTSTANYPTGGGIGTIRRITTWTPIAQVQTFDAAGGEPSFADITTIVDRVQKQVPTLRSAQTLTLGLFDDPLLAGQIAIQAASDNLTVAALRIIFPDASRMVANGYWSIRPAPSVTVNAPVTIAANFTGLSLATRYNT
jgi:hypothetical protein